MTTELNDLQKTILDWIENENEAPICCAKQVGEIFDISSQKASGALRSLENKGYLSGMTLGGSQFSVKAYFLPNLMSAYREIDNLINT